MLLLVYLVSLVDLALHLVLGGLADLSRLSTGLVHLWHLQWLVHYTPS